MLRGGREGSEGAFGVVETLMGLGGWSYKRTYMSLGFCLPSDGDEKIQDHECTFSPIVKRKKVAVSHRLLATDLISG